MVIGLLFLVLFGPSKTTSMARDLGRFVKEARHSVDEFKVELLSEEQRDDRRQHHSEL